MRLLVAIALIAASFAAAPATDATAMCPDNTLCFWSGINQTGEQVNVSKRKGVSNKIGNRMNNDASSAENDTGYAAILYDKRNGRGVSICIDPTGVAFNLSDAGFDNFVYSTKVLRRASCH